MSTPDFSGSMAMAPQVPNASPTRFGMSESTAAAVLASKVDQTLACLKFITIPDVQLDILVHLLTSNGPDSVTTLLESGGTISAATPYDVDATINGDPGESVRVQLREIAGRFELLDYSGVAASGVIKQPQFQIASKAQAAIRKRFGYLFINGDSGGGGGEFDGLDRMAVLGLGQTFSHAPTITDPLTEIDDAIGRIWVDDRAPGDLAIMCNTRAWRKILELGRAAGSDPSITFEYCAELGGRSMHFNGVPVFVNDHIVTTGNDPDAVTNIYVFSRRNVVGLVNERRPNIDVSATPLTSAKGMNYVVSWWVAIASFTGLGLVILEDWPVSIS